MRYNRKPIQLRKNVLWMPVCILFAFYIFFYIKSGYYYWSDTPFWFIDVLSDKQFHIIHKGRTVAFIMLQAPQLLSMNFTDNIPILSNIFLSTIWLWSLISFLLSSFIVDKSERYLLSLYPIIWIVLGINPSAYPEMMCSLMFVVPVSLFLLSNCRITLTRELLIYILLLCSCYTHESIIFFHMMLLLFTIKAHTFSIDIKNKNTRLSLVLIATITIDIINIYNPTVPANANDFIHTIVKFNAFAPAVFFLCCFIALYIVRLSNKFKKIRYLFYAIFIICFFYLTFFLYRFDTPYKNYLSRVYILPVVAMSIWILLQLKKRSTFKNDMIMLNALSSVACLIFLILSFYPLLIWNQYFDDLYIDVTNKTLSTNHVVYYRQPLNIKKYGQLSENYSNTVQSVIAQILHGKQNIDQVIIYERDLYHYDKIQGNLIAAEMVLRSSKIKGVEISEGLRRSLRKKITFYLKRLRMVDKPKVIYKI